MNFVDTLRDFQTLGAKDQVKCALGARVFLDLENDNRVTDLEKCYNSDLNLVYLQGKRDKANVSFIPVLSSQPLNFLDIESIQKVLMKRKYDTYIDSIFQHKHYACRLRYLIQHSILPNNFRGDQKIVK